MKTPEGIGESVSDWLTTDGRDVVESAYIGGQQDVRLRNKLGRNLDRSDAGLGFGISRVWSSV